MSKIQTFLQNILSARYGKDVRQSIHDAIQEIDKVADTAQGSATEAAEIAVNSATAAEQYRNETKQYRDEAALFTPDNYTDLVDQVNTNTIKIDTVIEKADLGIKETASGEEIHLTDSAESKVVEFALYGKATQNTTSGKNLITISEYATNASGNMSKEMDVPILEIGETYIVSGKATDGTKVSTYNCQLVWKKSKDETDAILRSTHEMWSSGQIVDADTSETGYFYIYTTSDLAGKTIQLQLEKGTVATDYEPYTGGQPSPSPDYPQEIEVSGESYNLLENTTISQTVNGVTVTVNEDKIITFDGKVSGETAFNIGIPLLKANEEYILSGCPSGGGESTYYMWLDGYTALTQDVGNGKQFALSEDNTTRYIRFVIKSGVTVSNLTVKPMIRKATVKNDRYMPYGVGSVEVKSVGVQLFNMDDITLKAVISNGVLLDSSNYYTYAIRVVKGKKYTLKKDVTSSTLYSGFYNEKPSVGVTLTNRSNISSNEEITFEAKDNYYCLVIPSSYQTSSIMLNEGETALPYQQYKESKAIINGEFAGIKVSSNGNYTDQSGQQWICDEIVKYADGSGAFVQRVKKVVLNGDERWATSSSIGANGFYSLNAISDGIVNISPMLCDKFVSTTVTANSKMEDNQIRHAPDSNKTSAYVYLKTSVAETVDELKTFLTENNATCYYILAEPITTPLTAEEIAEIEKLQTFYPVTNISNDFDCGMKVTYLADSKNYIDNQLALQAQAKEAEMMAMFMLLPEETQAKMIENDINNLLTESEV